MIFKNKIGLGTSLIGLRPELVIGHENLINYAIDNGCRLYDTAESYTDGSSESIIGRCITASSVGRAEFEIVTKFNPYHDPVLALEKSLERLQTTYVDTYLMHFLKPGPRTIDSVKPTIEKLVKIKESKQAKHTGVCSVTADELLMWRSAEEQLGVPDHLRINVCQFQYSLVKRQADIQLQPLLLDLGFTSMPYSPFGGGRMSGSSRPPQPGFPGDFWVNERTQQLAPIAESIGATVPQLILAFINRFNNSVVFPKTFNQHRLIDNLKSTQFIPMITKPIYDQINNLYPIDFNSQAIVTTALKVANKDYQIK